MSAKQIRPYSSTTEATSIDEDPCPEKRREPRHAHARSIAQALSSHPIPPQTRSWDVKAKHTNPARNEVFIPNRTESTLQTPEGHSTTTAGTTKIPYSPSISERLEAPQPTTASRLGDDWVKISHNMTQRLKEARVERIRQQSKLSNESVEFFDIYERKLRLEIKGILKDEKGTFSLAVRRGRSPDHWIIDIMTEECLTGDITTRLEGTKECLPPQTRDKIQFDLRGGEVERTADTQPRSSGDEDWSNTPVNVLGYDEMCMGDSVGPDWRDSSATLGPMLLINEKPYWLLCWHTFDANKNAEWDKTHPPRLKALHPSLDDSEQWQQNRGTLREIGHAVAYSGLMYRTQRLSVSADGPCETDWVLIEANSPVRANKMRSVCEIDGLVPCVSFSEAITETADPVLARFGDPTIVCAVGRSSGMSYGQIGPVLADMRHKDGRETREWYIEPTGSVETTDAWNSSMMGVPGDSGAGIIDSQNRLLGQIWGRNRYKGDPAEPRLTYFTKISTLFDDIQERFSCSRPTLPQRNVVSQHQPGVTPHGIDAEATSGPPVEPLSLRARRSNARRSALARRGGDWGHVYPHAKTWPIPPPAKEVVISS